MIILPSGSFRWKVCRRAEEADMERKLVEREEAALMKEKRYATLDQEVKDTKKKLKKLLNKHEVHSTKPTVPFVHHKTQ